MIPSLNVYKLDPTRNITNSDNDPAIAERDLRIDSVSPIYFSTKNKTIWKPGGWASGIAPFFNYLCQVFIITSTPAGQFIIPQRLITETIKP